MKTLYKHYVVGLVCTVVLLLQTTSDVFARSTEKKHFIQHLLLHKKKVKPGALEMKGRIQSDAGTMSAVNITVFVDSVQFLSTSSGRSGKCKFILPLDEKYTIVFSTPGYRTKKIVVNAKVNSPEQALHTFRFTINMLEEQKEVAIQDQARK